MTDEQYDPELVTHAKPRGRRRRGDPITACGRAEDELELTIEFRDMSKVSCPDCIEAFKPPVHLHSPEWEWRGNRQINYTACGIANPKDPVTVDLERVTCSVCLANPIGA